MRNSLKKKSLRLAGYCKPIQKDKVFLENISGEEKIKWNTNQRDWHQYTKAQLDIGNAYDILGFDIDFAAVYVGKDVYLGEDNKIRVDKTSFYDRGTKKGVDDIDKFVKNAYYILLTRAIYGQMVYFEDEKLRKFFIDYFNSK